MPASTPRSLSIAQARSQLRRRKKKIAVAHMVVLVAAFFRQRAESSIRSRDKPFAGKTYTARYLLGHEGRLYDSIRMNLPTFLGLLNWLEVNAGLKGSRHVDTAEKLLFFLTVVSQGHTNRAAEGLFGHSSDTRHRLVTVVWDRDEQLTDQNAYVGCSTKSLTSC